MGMLRNKRRFGQMRTFYFDMIHTAHCFVILQAGYILKIFHQRINIHAINYTQYNKYT